MLQNKFTPAAYGLALALPMMALSAPVQADRYIIDIEGQHAFIDWRISHLGFSWLHGRFNDFDGHFTYDPDDLAASEVYVEIDMASIDSNHVERDEHLRDADFFDVAQYPQAVFQSTGVEPLDNDRFTLIGDMTIKGITHEIEIDATKVGAGEDPWGSYRAGFFGTTEIKLKDFGIDYDLGPAATTATVILSVEGIRE